QILLLGVVAELSRYAHKLMPYTAKVRGALLKLINKDAIIYLYLVPDTAKIRGEIMIKRDYYLNRLIHNMWNGEIKVITGIRRCGKSVLLFDLFYEYLLSQGVKEEQIIRLELDQRRNYKYRNPITLCDYVDSIVSTRKDE